MKRQQWRKFFLILSFLLFPITQFYFSPYLIIIGISQGIIAGSFIIFSLLFIGGIFMGRSFCGWIMPCGGIQEILFLVRDKKVKPEKIDWIKYLIWVPWILFIIFLMIRHSGNFQADFTFHTDRGISIAARWMYIIYYSVLFLFLIAALFIGKRGACHTACWMSPFMIMGKKLGNLLRLPRLKLLADSSKCIKCGLCDKNCPMSLPVQDMTQTNKLSHSECILCGTCVDICPKKVLRFSFGIKK